MSVPRSHDESPTVSLIFGLVAVLGVLFVSVIALAGPVWMGLVFGIIELVVAWRVTPPAGARSLRWVTGTIGAFTLAFAVARALIS